MREKCMMGFFLLPDNIRRQGTKCFWFCLFWLRSPPRTKKAWSSFVLHAPRAFAMLVTRRKTNEVHAEYVVYTHGATRLYVHENTYPRTFIVIVHSDFKKLRSFWESQTTSINVLFNMSYVPTQARCFLLSVDNSMWVQAYARSHKHLFSHSDYKGTLFARNMQTFRQKKCKFLHFLCKFRRFCYYYSAKIAKSEEWIKVCLHVYRNKKTACSNAGCFFTKISTS